MIRSWILAAMLSATTSMVAFAQTAEDLKNDANTPEDVLVYGMGYAGQRYSPLTQINKQNVGRMMPVWSYSLADIQGAEAFPLVRDGVIFVTTHSTTAAIDAMTGKAIWRVAHEYPPDALRV